MPEVLRSSIEQAEMSTATVKPDTLYRLRAGQGVIRTGATVTLEQDGKFITADSYTFVYQPEDQDPMTFWPIQRSTPPDRWEPVPTYPVHLRDIWMELRVVPAALEEVPFGT